MARLNIDLRLLTKIKEQPNKKNNIIMAFIDSFTTGCYLMIEEHVNTYLDKQMQEII